MCCLKFVPRHHCHHRLSLHPMDLPHVLPSQQIPQEGLCVGSCDREGYNLHRQLEEAMEDKEEWVAP